MTLREARRRFFAASGFATDGGYDDRWADAQFGPLPYSVPNPAMRAAALRVHDLHHPLAGYTADWRGEAQISAWELGSGGGGRYIYAWFVALFGLVTGLLALPRATWHAFVRGRGSRNLYREASPLRRLGERVETVRQSLGISGTPRSASIADAVWFGLYTLAASSLTLFFALGSPLLVAAAVGRRAVAGLRCPYASAPL